MSKSHSSRDYRVGVMIMDVEGKNSERFRHWVSQAADAFKNIIADTLGIAVKLLAFEGPHLMPSAGTYAPLDFLQIGMNEKLERNIHFLLIVTEVDLSTTTFSYTPALPSQLTNVGVISTKRLNPAFWGEENNDSLVVKRLTALLFHTFGHLLNLSRTKNPQNVMYDFADVEALAAMVHITDKQRQQMRQTLPQEAHERTSRNGHWKFILSILVRDWRSIARAVIRANPFHLVTRLPTMITAALSVIIVVFFSAEIWDVASAVELYQLALFSVVAITAATVVLYRAFAFSSVLSRGRVLAESTVVTSAATVLCLLLTMLILFAIFVGLTYLGAIAIFPRKLMETWPTVDPAVRVLDHVKLSLFVAALGVLAGSLGGRADSKDLVHSVLFVDKEM